MSLGSTDKSHTQSTGARARTGPEEREAHPRRPRRLGRGAPDTSRTRPALHLTRGMGCLAGQLVAFGRRVLRRHRARLLFAAALHC
jgi:hypothetical protein